ncbi:hypothetical protein Dsin_001742 [Dipteronia sinensis]|uniref:RNase H type-1 domain-containing protein n=1 Tax=Dipteronia sinensis TaxID=43782 RepID=A0AAE0B4Y7_9ROSI|nr:hypothetical protein Dsin_001742 [Dipteronia sinensis]
MRVGGVLDRILRFGEPEILKSNFRAKDGVHVNKVSGPFKGLLSYAEVIKEGWREFRENVMGKEGVTIHVDDHASLKGKLDYYCILVVTPEVFECPEVVIVESLVESFKVLAHDDHVALLDDAIWDKLVLPPNRYENVTSPQPADVSSSIEVANRRNKVASATVVRALSSTSGRMDMGLMSAEYFPGIHALTDNKIGDVCEFGSWAGYSWQWKFSVRYFRKEIEAREPGVVKTNVNALLWCEVLPPKVDLFLSMVTKEVLAILEACNLCDSASSLINQHIVIKSDSKSVVAWVNGLEGIGNVKNMDPILEIKEIIKQNKKISILFTPRSGNVFANILAGSLTGLVQTVWG